jgi:hypothetical protein
LSWGTPSQNLESGIFLPLGITLARWTCFSCVSPTSYTSSHWAGIEVSVGSRPHWKS